MKTPGSKLRTSRKNEIDLRHSNPRGGSVQFATAASPCLRWKCSGSPSPSNDATPEWRSGCLIVPAVVSHVNHGRCVCAAAVGRAADRKRRWQWAGRSDTSYACRKEATRCRAGRGVSTLTHAPGLHYYSCRMQPAARDPFTSGPHVPPFQFLRASNTMHCCLAMILF